jgi:hypothetical protein
MIRPHGHKRSAAIGNANIDFCYRKTGLTRYEVDTQTFKDCMMTRGYHWLSAGTVPDPPDVKSTDDSFIDPDTWMSCRDVGGRRALCAAAGHRSLSKSARPQLHAHRKSLRFARTCRVSESAATGDRGRHCKRGAFLPNGFSPVQRGRPGPWRLRLVQPIAGADEVVRRGEIAGGVRNHPVPSIVSSARFHRPHQAQLKRVAAVFSQHANPAEISGTAGAR